MAVTARRIVLKTRPVGAPTPTDFSLIEAPVPSPGDGEILTRTIYLSLDPYMRGRISGVKSYAKGVDPGDLMVGGTVGEVIESKHPGFKAGDLVQGYDGWQTHGISKGVGVRALDPKQAPISTALGVLGMPGMTAYVGLLDIGQPKPGETVVVSAASGAVGAVVGQIAKIKGCRVVGIAGGKDKCEYVVNELGFDACVDYKPHDSGPPHPLHGRRSRHEAAGGVPQGHRRLLRERGRRGARRRAEADQPVRAHPVVRARLPVQRDRDAGGPELGRAAREPRAREGLHRLGSPRSHAGLPEGRRPVGP
jgi:hypothetical protein